MDSAEIKRVVEAALLAAEQPVSRDKLLTLFQGQPVKREDLTRALETLARECEGRGVELREVASGFRFQVRRDLQPFVSRLWDERPPRYSRALLETLALIAYRQPITRGEIEEVRGVSVSTNIIRTLMDREWVQVVGHRDVPGKPALLATTREFLDSFDLKSLEDLPSLSEIKDIDSMAGQLDFDHEPQGGADDDKGGGGPDDDDTEAGGGGDEGEAGDESRAAAGSDAVFASDSR